MALVTASEIITNVSTRGIDTSMLLAADIEATEYNRIRTALGVDMYDAIVTDIADETGLYDTCIAYLKKALSFFVVADLIDRINIEVSDRGLFNLQAENTSKPDRDGIKAVKREYYRQGNGFMNMAIGWLIDNKAEDYINNMTDVATDYTYPMYTSNARRDTRL